MSHTGCLLCLLLLLDACKVLGHIHSLCLNLTVKTQFRPGQPWCEAQGSVDEKRFLYYDCDNNKVTPLGWLGEQVNASKALSDLTKTLREVGKELRIILSNTKLKKNIAKGSHTLQAKLSCQREAQRSTGASWEFSINGQRVLFDAMSREWSAINPGARGFKEEWENDSGLVEYLSSVSKGDCNHWLRNFHRHWEEILEPAVSPSKTLETSKITWIVIAVIIFIFSVILYALSPRSEGGHQPPLEARNRLASGSLGSCHSVRTLEGCCGSHPTLPPDPPPYRKDAPSELGCPPAAVGVEAAGTESRTQCPEEGQTLSTTVSRGVGL